VITAFPMKLSPGSKTLSCINKGCFVRVLLAVMCLPGKSCLMAASVSCKRKHERAQTVLYFNIAAIYGYRGTIYIDLNLIMILLAILHLYIFKGSVTHRN